MKIDRQIGILSVLMRRGRMTAPELAEKFEVSRRTISRDIEDICRAGIPLRTQQGSGGGISIEEGFVLDKTLLTENDMRALLEGISGLDSIASGSGYRNLVEKITSGRNDSLPVDRNILIDLSAWSKEGVSTKIERIRQAIDAREKLRFTYCSPSGENERTVEPYFLLFKWSAWYLWAWCELRQEFRLFRLSRIRLMMETHEKYLPREPEDPAGHTKTLFDHGFSVTVRFQPEAKWRLIDFYGDNCYSIQEDGTLLFSTEFSNRMHAIEWLLGFGAQAELLDPIDLREELAEIVQKMAQLYSQT